MSQDSVAESYARNAERWREYKRNRQNNSGWESETPRAAYDANVSEMSNEQIVNQHSELLQMQETEDYHNREHTAKDIARRRMELWKEAESRGIKTKLLE